MRLPFRILKHVILTAAFLCTQQIGNAAIALSGIDSTSGYTPGPVNGQGGSEPGWLGPWGGNSNAVVQNSVVYQGDQALQILPTSLPFRTIAQPVADTLIIEQRVRFGAGAQLIAYTELNSQGESTNFQGAVWQALSDGTFRVNDGIRDGGNDPSLVKDTGFRWKAGVWYDVKTVINVAGGYWDFYVDGVKYNAPDPLGFRGDTFLLDRVQYLSEGSGSVYLDSLSITSVPEPSSMIFVALASACGLMARRRRTSRLGAIIS